jgi:hypothetical protein
MSTLPHIERLTLYSRWIGFASPPSRTEKWTAARDGEQFRWRVEPTDQTGTFPADQLTPLLMALDLPPVPTLDPARFDCPPGAIERHYGSMWTDDHPNWLLGVLFSDSRFVELSSDAQHAYMLSIRVNDSARDRPFDTFEPTLSTAVALLLPDDFQNKERMVGRSRMLEYDSREPEPADEPAPAGEPEPAGEPLTPEQTDAAFDEMTNILFGIETPEQKEEAERSGDISRPLLKRISADRALDLIARGADVNIADDVGQTALMRAAFPPFNREKFRALVAAGADVEARRNDGMTGLLIACAGGESAAAAEWVRAGADIHARGPENCTPLLLAARWPRIVELLLAAGADVTAADDDGHTALAYAVIQQCAVTPAEEQEAVRLLLQAGADPNQPDAEGRTPTDHARRMLAAAELEVESILAMSGRPPEDHPSEWLNDRVNHARSLLALLTEFGGR